jgi:hypothetical protein
MLMAGGDDDVFRRFLPPGIALSIDMERHLGRDLERKLGFSSASVLSHLEDQRRRLLPFAGLAAEMQRERRLHGITFEFMERKQQEIEHHKALLNQVVPPFLNLEGTLTGVVRSQVAQWQSLDPVTSHFGLAAALTGYEKGLGPLLNGIQSVGSWNRDAFSSRLFRPTETYSAFVAETVALADATDDDVAKDALESSLELAAEEYAASSDAAAEFLAFGASPTSDESADEVAVVPLQLYKLQRDELVRNATAQPLVRGGALDEQPKIRVIASLACELLHRVLRCNAIAKERYGADIFKYTDRTALALVELGALVPTDFHSFGVAVDHLFFLLYEGAGSKNLRFIVDNGGVLKPSEASPIVTTLKHLRNKFTRHDIEHGDEKEIRKSFKARLSVFESLGLTRQPITASEYYGAYAQLLISINQVLDDIMQRLSEPE